MLLSEVFSKLPSFPKLANLLNFIFLNHCFIIYIYYELAHYRLIFKAIYIHSTLSFLYNLTCSLKVCNLLFLHQIIFYNLYTHIIYLYIYYINKLFIISNYYVGNKTSGGRAQCVVCFSYIHTTRITCYTNIIHYTL
jgi:hypothetical protein